MIRIPLSSTSLLLSSAAALALTAGAAQAQAQTSAGTTVSAVTVTAERAVQSYQPPAQAAADDNRKESDESDIRVMRSTRAARGPVRNAIFGALYPDEHIACSAISSRAHRRQGQT